MTQVEKQVFWREHVAAWSMSGVSQRAYCEQHDLKLASFAWWRKRLSSAEATHKLIPVNTTSLRFGTVSLLLPGGLRLEGKQDDPQPPQRHAI